MRSTVPNSMTGLFFTFFACLLTDYFTLLLLDVKSATAAEPKIRQALCRSKPVTEWIASVITEKRGGAGSAYSLVLVKPLVGKLEAGRLDLTEDPIIEKVVKQVQAEPFGPKSHSILFMTVPENLGVHVKTGVSSCAAHISIRTPEENPSTGMTVLKQSGEMSFFYRIVPPNQRGALLIVLVGRDSGFDTIDSVGMPSSVDSIIELIQDAESGKDKLERTYKTVTAYEQTIQWGETGYHSNIYGVIVP